MRPKQSEVVLNNTRRAFTVKRVAVLSCSDPIYFHLLKKTPFHRKGGKI